MEKQSLEPVAIRIASTGDLKAIYRIEQSAVQSPWSRSAIVETLESDCAVNLVAVGENGDIRGYLLGAIVADELSIHYLVTHPQYRRRGIGRELIEAAAKKARDLGARIAYLEVRLKNEAAQALYRACGFIVRAERKKYYADDGDSALLMAMRLE